MQADVETERVTVEFEGNGRIQRLTMAWEKGFQSSPGTLDALLVAASVASQLLAQYDPDER